MKHLHHLFGSTETLAKEMAADEQAIAEHWKAYTDTVPKKKDIIDGLQPSFTLKEKAEGLTKLLHAESLDILAEEQEESELLEDLERVAHDRKVKRVRDLERAFGYFDTRHEHVHQLLRQLHDALRTQAKLVKRLLKGAKEPQRIIEQLRSQSAVEQECLDQLTQMQTFPAIFHALVQGEHLIKRMDEDEQQLLAKMKHELGGVFSGEVAEGMTYEWAMAVFNAIEDHVHQSISKGFLDAYHPDVDFESVNRPEFVELAKETIMRLRSKEVSPQMLDAFVHVFREWYNHERD